MAKSSVLSGSMVVSDGENGSFTLPFSVTDSQVNEISPIEEYVLAPSDTDKSINFGRMGTAKYIVITSDSPFDVLLDGNAEYNSYKGIFAVQGSYTSIKLQNPSSTATATVKVMLAGVR